jgi:hypothetical protein
MNSTCRKTVYKGTVNRSSIVLDNNIGISAVIIEQVILLNYFKKDLSDSPISFYGIICVWLFCMLSPHVNVCNSVSFWILWYMIPSNRMAAFNRCFAVITYGLHNVGLNSLSSVTYNLNGTEFNFILCEVDRTKIEISV